MNSVSERDNASRRRRHCFTAVQTDRRDSNEETLLVEGQFWTLLSFFPFTMNKTTRISLIAFMILVIAALTIFLLNLESIKSSLNEEDWNCIKLEGSESCHDSNSQQYRYYGTKTAYHIAAETNLHSEISLADCKPKVFYLLSRHATRYPDEEYIVELISQLPALRTRIIKASDEGISKICQNDIQKLKEWDLNMKLEDDNRLSQTGEQEAEDLALRLKEKFASILNQTYSPDKFTIEYTSRARTRGTAEAFAKGLFGNKYTDIDFEDGENDEVLVFHKACKKLRKKCKDADYDVSEIEKFENGPLMQKVVQSISTRVGFNLTSEEVQLAQIACAFGYALNQSDAWCSLFTEEELQVLEYADDIDDYYKDAYGNEVNYKQACPIAKYIVDLFKNNANSSDPKVVLHFSHAGMIKKVYPLFGLFRDKKPLTADNFCYAKDRRWRSSLIAPFISNIAFVLLECGGELKVAALHNERPLAVDGCDGDILCPLEKFEGHYGPVAANCNLRKICCNCCKD